MAKISELTGEAREARVAELKQKMKEAAARAQAAHAAGTPLTLSGEATAVADEPAEVEVEAAPVEVAVAEPVADAGVGGNGATISKPLPAAAPAAPRPAAKPAPKPKSEEEVVPTLTPQEMNRREFLTYAWGAALGVLGLEAGVASFQYLYPRFRAGEFGGTFDVPLSELPDPSAAPIPNTAGKFWLVTTEDGSPKAIYMVCTHLGCLYKWEPSNVRFECPCHGSKFSHDGFYIEGPAPRSLDYFDVSEEGDVLVVDTGAKITGAPSTESPARAVPA
ncbi:MAG: Rieske 2Fe-2S domain-containing protein [Caldilineaceae bacterium]|nr:Rieske 2Fe-2S domain-containing protein [Caldilineaceae bacterium]